jgi:hypothetical protein
MSKVKYSITLLSAGRTTCLPSLRHPAYRQRELYTGIQTELVNLSERCQERSPSGRTRKDESIDAFHGGRATRSSEDGYGNVARAKGWRYQVLCSNRNCLRSNPQEV